MSENLFSRLNAEEKRRALDLDDFFLQSVLQSRYGDAVVTGIGVEAELALAAKMTDEDIRQAIEIVEWHKQAMAASEASEHHAAIECFEKIVQQAPFDAISWMSLGVQHAFLQNGRTAVDCLERALSEDPDNERIRGNLEAVRSDFGIVESARPVEAPTNAPPVDSSSVASQPESTGSQADMAKQHLSEFWSSTDMEADRKRGHHSCDCCQTPVVVNAGCLAKPNSGKPLQVNVLELEAKVAPERFQNLTQKIAKLSSAFKRLNATEGADFHEVEDQTRELLAESPFDTRLLLALGTIQFKQDQFDEALDSFSEANRCAPADAVIHYHLGKVHERVGNLERALRDYDRARRLDFTSASMRKAYYRLERQLYTSPEPSKSLTKDDVKKLLSNREYDELVRQGTTVIEALAQIIEESDYSQWRAAATVLSRIGEPAVPALAKRLLNNNKPKGARLEVIDTLSLIASPKAIRVLRDAMEYFVKENLNDYQCFVPALLRTGDVDALERILSRVHDKDESIRIFTVQFISRAGSCRFLECTHADMALFSAPAFAEALVERCQNETHTQSRVCALEGLLFTRLATAPRVVAKCLNDLSVKVRQSAARVLGGLAEQRVPLSQIGGTTPTALKRGDVWDVSGWTGNDGAISQLILLLGDRDKDVQRHVGLTLGYLGDLALPALVGAARTANDDVRIGIGWASQTMHDTGRRILADCGANLATRQRGQQVIKIQSKAPGALPGDVLIPIPSDQVGTSLFRDAKGRDHPLQVVYYDSSRKTLWGLDRDELPDGATVEAIEHSTPGEVMVAKSNVSVSDDVRKLNEALPNVWKAVKFSTEPCSCCGIHMPTSEDSDFMNLGFLGLLQNNPQAIATAIKVTAAYYLESSGPDLTNVNVMFGARSTIFSWVCLRRCERCKSWVCKRCEKLPHDQGGCSLCTSERKRREDMPSLVCETCFTKRQFEPWDQVLRSDNEPDIPAVPIPRRDKATQMVKPFYEKWSVTPVAECTACGLLMPTTSVMQPLLKRISKETGQDYNTFLDAIAKLYVMILGPEALGEPRNNTEQEQLIQKWHLTNCRHCCKPLCPACGKLSSTKRCVVCGTK